MICRELEFLLPATACMLVEVITWRHLWIHILQDFRCDISFVQLWRIEDDSCALCKILLHQCLNEVLLLRRPFVRIVFVPDVLTFSLLNCMFVLFLFSKAANDCQRHDGQKR